MTYKDWLQGLLWLVLICAAAYFFSAWTDSSQDNWDYDEAQDAQYNTL